MPACRPIVCSIVLLFGISIASLALILFSSQGVVTIALEIFLISALGFSLIASFSYRFVLFWRAVDFPWILTSFAAIVVSLVNISANDQRQYISTANTQISKAFSDLTYVTRRIITNDCETQRSERDIRQPSPEPYSGACDRVKHLLPQMIYASENLSDTKNIEKLNGWVREIIAANDNKFVGNWKDQVVAARRLIKSIDQYAPGLQKIKNMPTDTIESVILSTKLRIWYFVMAFFVGLRLSRTMAEVLQARSAILKRTEPGRAKD